MACLPHHLMVTGSTPSQQPSGCSAVKCFSSGMRVIHLPFMSHSFRMAEMFIQKGRRDNEQGFFALGYQRLFTRLQTCSLCSSLQYKTAKSERKISASNSHYFSMMFLPKPLRFCVFSFLCHSGCCCKEDRLTKWTVSIGRQGVCLRQCAALWPA